MNRHFRAIRTLARRDDGSMMLAILLAIVMTALIAASVIIAMAGQEKTQKAQAFTAGQQSVDAGVSDALSYGNRGGDYDCITEASPRTGTSGTTTWSWSAKAVIPAGAPASTCNDTPVAGSVKASPTYDITIKAATTGTTAGTREYVVRATSLRVPTENGASVVGNSIVYNTGDGPNMTGFFANTSLVMRGQSHLYSYNSGSGTTTWTGNGLVGSNGTVTFTNSATVDKVVLWDFKAQPNPDRCTGTPCTSSPTKISTQPVRLGVTGECAYTTPFPATSCTAPTKFIDEACKAQTALTPWIASEQGASPTLNAGTYCVSALVFDRNTTINATPANPVKVYVTGGENAIRYGQGNSGGAIVVAPGVQVNYSGGAPKSTSLLVYAKANTVSLGAGGAGDTFVAWNLFAPLADCSGVDDTSGTRWVYVYGSMTCNNLTTGARWALRYDEQQQLVAPNPATTPVWYVTSYTVK